MKILYILPALLCLLIISSCDSKTDTTAPPTEEKKVYASANSTFTYTEREQDPSGNFTGVDSVKTATVVEGAHSFAGKDTTITVVLDGSDTTIMSYEANGNVSIYRGNGVPGAPIPFLVPAWWTLPVKSKTAISIMDSSNINLSFSLGGFDVTLKSIKGDALHVGTEDVTVNGQSLKCEKTQVVFEVTVQVLILTQKLTFNTTYYFSEKIGYFAKYETFNTFPQIAIDAGLDPGNNTQTMTSYSLK